MVQNVLTEITHILPLRSPSEGGATVRCAFLALMLSHDGGRKNANSGCPRWPGHPQSVTRPRTKTVSRSRRSDQGRKSVRRHVSEPT
jgi:hypothetical protein